MVDVSLQCKMIALQLDDAGTMAGDNLPAGLPLMPDPCVSEIAGEGLAVVSSGKAAAGDNDRHLAHRPNLGFRQFQTVNPQQAGAIGCEVHFLGDELTKMADK